MLEPDEVELLDVDEQYFRQCHPSFIEDGLPSTMMFRDFPRDQGKLSGSRSSKTTEDQAYYFHTTSLELESAGTWAVSVEEVQGSGSRVVDDSDSAIGPDPCPPGHSYIDMRPLSKGDRKRLRNRLIIETRRRGRFYPKYQVEFNTGF